jgi:hypothetical protein
MHSHNEFCILNALKLSIDSFLVPKSQRRNAQNPGARIMPVAALGIY